MKLNHIDLHVTDVQETAQFLERYFGFKLLTSKTAQAIAVLNDGDGFSLVLQKLKNPSATYPEGFHIGFVQDDIQQVETLFQRLKDDGVDVGESIIVNNRGTMFYFYLPGGILTEVSASKKM